MNDRRNPEVDDLGRLLVGGFSPQSGTHIISDGMFWCNGAFVPNKPTVYSKYTKESINRYTKTGCPACDEYIQQFGKQ